MEEDIIKNHFPTVLFRGTPFTFRIYKNSECATKKTVKFNISEAEFKEFEPRLKYGWFHLNSYSMFQDLSRRFIETGFWGIWNATQIH